jgi:hypothetical protein
MKVVVVMLRPSDWDRSVFSEYFGPDRYGSSAGSIARASLVKCRTFKLARSYAADQMRIVQSGSERKDLLAA